MGKDAVIQELSNQFGNWWEHGFQAPEMTAALYPYTELFSPITINRLTIKNRIVMAPMGNISMCDETGRPHIKMLKYFEERAKGGVGLITTGLVPVSYHIDKSLIENGELTYFPRIDRSRTVFAPWRDLSAMCHSHGSSIFLQLTPGLGRVGNPQCLTNRMEFPRSASFNPNWYMKDVPCMRLSDMALSKIIKRIGQGAADAKACNLDGVYLHGHEGYLLEQVTNPAFNHRKLGRFATYETFGLEMVREIRRRVGPDYPIMYRIDLSLALEETYKDKMDAVSPLKRFKGGRTVEQTLEYMRHLVEAGVDIFDVDMGCYDNWWLPHPPASMPSGCYLSLSEITKAYFEKNHILSNKGLPVPVVAVGKLGYPDLAEQALRDNKCDMVMLGRPLLADPDWCGKAYAGDVKHIRPCIGCQEACLNEFVEGGHPQCAVNPRTAFEDEFPREVPKAERSKKVAVIGAGPAGIMAAQVLLKRGHQVVLFEKDAVGGSLVPGSKAKIKYEFANYLTYLKNVLADLILNPAFELREHTCADAETLKQEAFDVIITATGTKQNLPPVDGIEQKHVHFAIDVLMDPSLIADAEDIVVIGGGVVGAETAYMLKYECGKNVKVVEMDKYIMNHACTANRGHLIHYLEEGGVELLNCTKLLRIKEGTVEVLQNVNKNVPDPYVTWSPILPENVENPMDLLHKIKEENMKREIKADAVILAVGVKSENALYFNCVKTHAAAEIYNIGDSFQGGRVFEAVRSAYRKAISI